MILCNLAPNTPPYPPQYTPKNPKGTKNRHIQETGLPGTKWITGTYTTPIYNQDRPMWALIS